MDPEDGDDFDEIEDFEDTETEGVEPEVDVDEPGEEPEDIEAEPARKPSRASARIEELDRRAREAERLAQEAVARAEAAERRALEPSRADAERAERERLAQMDPWDRAEYLRRKDREETTRHIETLRRESADANDKADFSAACVSNPALAKVKEKVETELSKLRANGQTVPRQTLAAYLIGQQLLEKAPRARERAAKRGAANVDRERTRPAGGASNAPRGRDTNDQAARDKRLEDYTF